MTKLWLTAISLTLFSSWAFAQTLGNAPQNTKPAEEPKVVAKEAPKAEAAPTNPINNSSEIAPDPALAEQIALRGIKTMPTEEEKEVMREGLREDLRQSIKYNDLKENINYLEVNNRLEKTAYRRRLQQMGENYRMSARLAERKRKIQVNPKDEKQMEQYVFERAGVPENKDQ